jgi:flagellar hook-associated protein 2
MATSVSPTTTTSTTSAVPAALVTAANIAANNRTNAQKLITALGTGSGVDVASLAQNLTDAERVPKANAINAKINKNESRISGYAAIAYVATGVQTALNALKDQRNFDGAVASVGNAATVSASAGPTATEGSHTLTVTQLATQQRAVFGSSSSAGFSSATTSITGLTTGSLSLSHPITFQPLASGESVAINGLQFTASRSVTAAEVATAFASLSANATTGGGALYGAYTGTFLAGYSTGLASSGGSVAATQTIAATNPTDIVKEINGNAPLSGVKAQLVYSGSDYKIVLSGKTGAANTFSLTDSTAKVVGFDTANTSQAATDATFKINGVSFTRSSNQVGDALTGVTLNLKAVGTSSIDLTRDNSGLMSKVQDVVTAYNDAMSMLNVLSDPKSTVDTYGAALVGDSMVRTVREQLRNLMFTDSSASVSSSKIKNVRDLGISIDMKGTMTLDNAKLTDAFTNKFDQVVTAMTGDMNDLGEYSTAPAGIAGDASRALTKLLKTSGPIKTLSANTTTQNTKYQEDLTNLQTRMDALLVRYQKQFANMDSMVGRTNSLKTSLKGTFDGMSKSSN